jgi:hypothetical protein
MLVNDAITNGLLSQKTEALDTTHYEALDLMLNLSSSK